MDEFQATPAEEITRLRGDSAKRFGDLLLTRVVGELVNVGGAEAVDRARDAIAKGIREHPDHDAADDRAARLALEEFERAVEIATTGGTSLRGWTADAPPSLEEQK